MGERVGIDDPRQRVTEEVRIVAVVEAPLQFHKVGP